MRKKKFENITINISIPRYLYEEALAYIEKKGYYSSFSEFVRDMLRREIYFEEFNRDISAKSKQPVKEKS
ncbi:hypothetical protein HYW54_04645 [Candidatus Gottesmanbacteria bacterium]|nr:hypothetical protein [Candidatus Gottesmanbacteria bacterium]